MAESIQGDSAIEATPQYSALENSLRIAATLAARMDALEASPAGSGGDVGTELRDIRVGKGNVTYSNAGDAVRASVQGANFYLNTTRWSDFNNSFDDLPNNIVAPCGIDNSASVISGAPIAGQLTGMVMTFGRNATRTSGDTQVFIPWHGGRMFYRQYNAVSSEQVQNLAWSDWVTGSEVLETAIQTLETAVVSLPQYRSGVNSSHADYDDLLSHYTEDGVFLANPGNWNDLPNGAEGFIVQNEQYAANYISQTAISVSTGKIYNRVVHKTNFSVFRDWKTGSEALETTVSTLGATVQTLGTSVETSETTIQTLETAVAALPQYRGGVNASHDDYDDLLSNYTNDGTFLATSANWDDIPAKDTATEHSANNDSYMVTNAQYAGNYIFQTAVGIAKGAVYNRVISKADNTVFRDWFCVNLNASPMNILAVGDSICSGFRNGGKGFAGDLGMPFVNKGIAETTLSNVVDGTVGGKDRTCIPGQLARIPTQFPDYSPDIIIADGGINDYTHNAAMGAIPTAPVTDADGLNALDASTVMGGLQRLFYYMIELYPKAQRFFLIVHKMFAEFNGAFRYLPQYQNTAGYTQQELHDAIVQCCNVYNVKVIDVYRDSMLNTAFPQYRSDVAYSTDNTKTETEYVDLDGVHPMALGYREAYLPLIRQAISGIKGV